MEVCAEKMEQRARETFIFLGFMLYALTTMHLPLCVFLVAKKIYALSTMRFAVID